MKEIEMYRDTLGIKYIACRIVFPQASHDVIYGCIETFGKEVIPNFR